MNYVRHLNAFAKHAQLHPDWDAFHLSMYYVLFHVWNYKQFKSLFTVSREVLMRASRIGSKSKYYKCLKQLHQSGVITYYPADRIKQLATISMVELFEPKVKVTTSFCKDIDNVASAIVSDAGGVPNPGLACPINDTGGVSNIGRGGTIDDTGAVLDIGLPCGINATHSVPDVGHSLKEKTIKDLKSVCVNGHPPTGNNNFSFFSSPGTTCFPPGSLQEVNDYFLQQGYPLLEATNFFDYYAITGWKTRSGAPVVNWQCAARRWMLTAVSQQRIAINISKHERDQHLHTNDDKDYSEPL